jgi:hypothetical protein
MVPAEVSNPAISSNQAHSLEDVLMIAGQCETDPFCTSFGPLPGPGSKPAFAALITAQDRFGRLQAAWLSEPVFGTSEAALEHAEDMIGPDIYAIIAGYSDWQ